MSGASFALMFSPAACGAHGSALLHIVLILLCFSASLSSTVSRRVAPDVYYIQFNTTVPGSFVVKVEKSWAPIGAQHLYELVSDHFYDDAAFFRVVEQFIVQFGIAGEVPRNAVSIRNGLTLFLTAAVCNPACRDAGHEYEVESNHIRRPGHPQ